MDSVIQISKINDFIFCPYSLYYHSIYDNFSAKIYHETPQRRGKLKHENIENSSYSSSKKYLQGIPIYSTKYNLVGKIDIYDKEAKTLIERKYKLHQIYDGLKYQLYAQMFCLIEMGYKIEKLIIHSLSDNKRYEIVYPNKDEIDKFEKVIRNIWHFNLNGNKVKININKCKKCIYKELCSYTLC